MTRSETSNPSTIWRLSPELLLAGSPYVSLLGFLGLVVNALLSFEEPHREMLLASGLLVVAAPLAALLHFTTTRVLTPSQKRTWIAGVMGRGGLALFAAYFNSVDRSRATEHLATRRRGRRTKR